MENYYRRIGRLVGAVTAGLVWLAGIANATPITGGISFMGFTMTLPAGETLETTDELNFLPIPGLGGTALTGSGTGTYAGVPAMTSVTLNTVDLTPDEPYGLWSFSSGGTDYSFSLEDVDDVSRTSYSIALTGHGILHVEGYEDTEGIFSLSSQYPIAGTFSFSASAQAVPEPTTMILVGAGLLGLIGVSRRRKH